MPAFTKKAPPAADHPVARHTRLLPGWQRLSPLFTHTPSRFGFHAGEQALLREALLGGDDDLIARRLCVSLATLRKRWREMYERVSRIDPDFFCPPDDTAPPDESIGVRGVEKRRWLLGYLRHHPEELRPSPLSRH